VVAAATALDQFSVIEHYLQVAALIGSAQFAR
jgi:hypothetical protein